MTSRLRRVASLSCRILLSGSIIDFIPLWNKLFTAWILALTDLYRQQNYWAKLRHSNNFYWWCFIPKDVNEKLRVAGAKMGKPNVIYVTHLAPGSRWSSAASNNVSGWATKNYVDKTWDADKFNHCLMFENQIPLHFWNTWDVFSF